MGLRRAFAGAAIGGFLGAITNTPALSQVGFTAGMLTGGHHGNNSAFVDNHPRWSANHPRAASVLENSGPFGSVAGERFVDNHPGWARNHPHLADRMDLGGPSLAGNLYPAGGIAASAGFGLGSIFNSLAQNLMPDFSSPSPTPATPTFSNTQQQTGMTFGFNSV